MNICKSPKRKPSSRPQPTPQRSANRNTGIIARSTEPPLGSLNSLSALNTRASASSTAPSAIACSLLFLIFSAPFVFPGVKRTHRENPMRPKKLSYVGITRIRFKGTGLN